MRNGNASGFTLVELLIYSVIFAGVSLTLAYFLTTFLKVSGYQASAAEVASQANFILQKIEHEVANASTVTVNDNGDDEADGTLGSPYAKLVMKDRAEDGADASDPNSPVSIWRDTETGDVMMKTGNQAATALNKSTVKATSLTFTKVSTPPGKDVVLVSLILEYQSPTPAERISRQFALGVTKASAATFDTQIAPNGTTLDIGSSIRKWRSLYLSQDMNIDRSVIWTTASTTSDGSPATNNSITMLKQGVIAVKYTLNANEIATFTYSTATSPTDCPTCTELQGVQAGNKIFMTPPPALNGSVRFLGARTQLNSIEVKLQNTGGTTITNASNNWSYLIIR